MDCDDVMLLLAAGDAGRTRSSGAQVLFHQHLEGCETCRALTIEAAADQLRWIARIPDDAFDDPDALVLPTVDPVVFERGDELARGGMGRITRARDRRLGRDVALKEVLAPVLRARFEREAMITARLQHPAIVPIYEAGTWPDGSAFYTMRLVSGGTLADAIDRAAALEDRLALLPHVIALTEALAYAHAQRIVHRDLKPGNVLVGEFGETVVIDWGLAKDLGARPQAEDRAVEAHGSAALTRAGSVIGTPCFIAPEQAAGGEIDERADVYALGAILYNLLAGHPPHWDTGERTPDRLVEVSREVPPTPIASLAPLAPADLRAIVERAMARDRRARYPTAKHLAEELRRFAAGQLLGSRDYPLRELLARWIARHRAVVGVTALALIVVAAVGAGALINVARSREAERTARTTAERALVTADARVLALLEEQGRNELMAGARERALAYLAAAYRGGRDGAAIRHLLAVATRDLELFDHAIEPRRNAISSIGFLDDGRAVTVDDMDSATIALWDGASQIAAYPVGQRVLDSRLSPDARRAAIVLDGGRIAVYDTTTGRRAWQVTDPIADQPELVFDPAGSSLVVIPDRTRRLHGVQLRDAGTGAVRATLVAGAGPPVAAAFSPDGSLVATCGEDGAVGVWMARTGTLVASSRGDRALTAIAFAGDARLVIGSEQGDARIWQFARSATVQLAGHYGAITAIAARDDAIATGDRGGAVRLWSAAGALLGEAREVRGAVAELAFSPDGAVLAGDGGDKRAYVWDARSLALRRAITAFEHGSKVVTSTDGLYRAAAHGLAWRRDGARLATVGFGEQLASVWRAPGGDRVAAFASGASAVAGELAIAATRTALTATPLATGRPARPIHELALHLGSWTTSGIMPDHVQPGGDGHVLVWDTEHATVFDATTGAKLAELPATPSDGVVSSFVLSPDGRLVVERNWGDRSRLRLFDATTGHLVRELVLGDISEAAFAPDGDRLVVTFAYGKRPVMWRVSTGASAALAGIDGYAPRFHFDPSGRRLIFFTAADAVVIEADTGAAIATIPHAGPGRIDDGRFDGDGHRVVVWADDRSATLWDLDRRAVLASVEGVPRLAFGITDDGQRLATGSDDGAIRIWDSASARLLEVIHGDGAVETLAWSGDGTRLLAQSTGEAAAIWDVHLEQRSAAEIDELASRTGWKVVDGLLVRAAR